MKKTFLLLFALLPMMLSAQNLTLKEHPNKSWLYGYWGEKKNGKEGFVIKPKFEKAHPFVGEYAFVRQNGLWGVIGKDGKFVVEPKYSSASQPYNGITIVQLGSKYGLVRDCKDILRIEYESIEHLKTGAFRLKKDGRVGLADANGKIIIPIEYQDIAIYNNGYKLKANNLFGLADVSGRIFLLVEYEDIADYNGGYKLKANSKYGLADASGKIVLEVKFKEILSLQDNLFAVYADKWAFINGDGDTFEQPNNVLLYTSNDGNIIDRSRGGYDEDYKYYWQVNVVSNTYHNGQGMMVFDKPITEIGDSAFKYCDNLTSITIPDSVTEIGSHAFSGCESLTSITIPDSVTEIGSYAFSGCKSLTSITIPNGVTSIGERTFEGCTGLTSITIPNSITSIGERAFEGWTGLTSITIPNSITSIGSWAFSGCKSLTSITIPDSVTEIGDCAFSDCGSLVNITLGSGVTHIGGSVFDGCSHLKEIHFPDLAAWCRVYWDGKEDASDRETKVYVGGKDIKQIRDSYEITIPSGVEHIANHTFANFRNLSSITIPNSVTEIGAGAFKYCTSLKSVTIPNSVTEIGGYAFCYCEGLTNITIPNSVTEIGERAFDFCHSLKSVYFKSTRPPHLGLAAFVVYWSNKDINFYVPKASIKEYQYAGSWNSLYWNIKAGNY